MDNGTAFRSEMLREMLDKWHVSCFFLVAYQSSGKEVMVRKRRTIKTMSERDHISPVEAIFWYNMSPKLGQAGESVPSKAIFKYK